MFMNLRVRLLMGRKLQRFVVVFVVVVVDVYESEGTFVDGKLQRFVVVLVVVDVYESEAGVCCCYSGMK